VIKGTHQAEAIDQIKSLPFYDRLTTIYKDSIHPAVNTGFESWLANGNIWIHSSLLAM
jgi:hypothetical protein